MNRMSLLPLVFLCFGAVQNPVLAQDSDQNPSLRSIAKKLDLLLERIDAIDRRLQKIERTHDGSEFSLLRPSDKSRNAADAEPGPVDFDVAAPTSDQHEPEVIFGGIEKGMMIDALQRNSRNSRALLLQKPHAPLSTPPDLPH